MHKAIEMVKKDAEASMDLASTVSDKVNIENVCLVETHAKRGVIRNQLPGTIEFSVNTNTRVDEKRPAIVVQAKFGLLAKYEDAPSGDEALRLEAVFQLLYTLDTCDGLTKQNFNAFGQLNGLYNAWPYWREYVQAMTARMGLPSMTIPVLKPAPQGKPSPSASSLPPPMARVPRGKKG